LQFGVITVGEVYPGICGTRFEPLEVWNMIARGREKRDERGGKREED
jgi:hypothetical protein